MRSDQGNERPDVETETEAGEVEDTGTVVGETTDPEVDSGDGASAGELAQSRDRLLRLAAEFENYRKRTERERGESFIRAQAKLVERLLEPLDDLQRVAHFTAENATAESLLEGVQMVERKLMRVLENAGLTVLEARGEPFDPSLHEALMTTDAETREEDDTVGEVFQSGYQFKGVLLRPARVQVKKYQG